LVVCTRQLGCLQKVCHNRLLIIFLHF
jgi:hypothetical protein